jgi:hypothetical protein
MPSHMFGPILLEVEPGYYVDLAHVLEFNDNPEAELLLITLPAPAFIIELSDGTSDDGSGPHALVLDGEARRLALAYVYQAAERSRRYLEDLAGPATMPALRPVSTPAAAAD